jgi:hypothetical protein
MMNKTTGRLLGFSALLVLGACARDPYLGPGYYGGYGYGYGAPVPPPPLQPYVEPAATVQPAPVPARRHVKRHYHRKRYYRQARCPCLSGQ